MQTFHLVPDSDQWILTKEGSECALGHFDSRHDAMEWCTNQLMETSGLLHVHREDGTVEERP